MSASVCRTKIEYGGCSMTNRCRVPVAGDPLRFDDLTSREGGGADVANLALVNEVAQRTQGLLDIGVGAGPVNLVEVDPVGVEPAQGVLDLTDDPAPGAALLIGVLTHRAMELGGQDNIVPASPARAFARISSDSPCEYTSAVSMKLIPASSAR
jgi:hypothetical protein